MRELDLLLTDYLDHSFPRAEETQKRAFRELLALPDPELISYLLGGQTPQNSELAAIVRYIRDHPHA